MDSIVIEGGRPLRGQVHVSGAKNAVLPLLCASILAEGRHEIRNVPKLRDIETTYALLKHLGLSCHVSGNVTFVQNDGVREHEAPYDLVKKMRASVLVLGPLLARYGKARVSLPGGCAIGARPIDEHVQGLTALGARVVLEHGYVDVSVPPEGLRGADIRLTVPSVTGTENLMCAASLAQGRTVIHNAAREPEISDLAHALRCMGADIKGDGTPTIVIEGQRELKPMAHTVMPDRIEAGTYMTAVAASGGEARIHGAVYDHLAAVCETLRSMGVSIDRSTEHGKESLVVAVSAPLRCTDVVTAPFPGFPTDMQAQLMALMCIADGPSHITETIFENRFMHVSELRRMGARISLDGRVAFVDGPVVLQGAEVMATDLRASACLVIAALVAKGTTHIQRVYHLDRGYESIERKLSELGGAVRRVRGSM